MNENKPIVLWVDLTLHGGSAEVQGAFGAYCDVHRAGAARAATMSPQLICFEYDYPDVQGLRLLQETKASYPSIPILMLTLQHSEALAVWAFRARVWDYLVTPVAHEEVQRVCSALKQLTALQEGSYVRTPLKSGSPLPTEVRFFGDSDRRAVRAALEYIHTHFAEKVLETTVAGLCGMNRFQFSRVFRKTQGITFNEYLIRYRVREACRLLQNPAISVTEAALMVGFSDVSHFGRMFKRFCGVLPSVYKSDASTRAKAASAKVARTQRQENIEAIALRAIAFLP